VDEEVAGTEIVRRCTAELAVDLSTGACVKNKSRLDEPRTCLLILGSCSLVFHFVLNGMNIQECGTVCYFAWCFVGVWSFLSDSVGRTRAEGEV